MLSAIFQLRSVCFDRFSIMRHSALKRQFVSRLRCWQCALLAVFFPLCIGCASLSNAQEYGSKVENISAETEKMLVEQLGRPFSLLQIVDEKGETVYLKSNRFDAIVADEDSLPKKRILLLDIDSQTQFKYEGSPHCTVIKIRGSLIVLNLEGGSVEECYK